MDRRAAQLVQRSGQATQKLTAAVLAFYGYKCWLELPGCTGLATTKDHVIPVAHGGTDAMDNFRPACASCNSKRRDLAISGIGGITVTVLVGPPTAPFAQTVQLHAQPGDIVVDLDRIRQALTIPGQPTSSRELDRIIARTWRTAMDQALRSPARCGVWIVYPIPTAKQLQQYARLRYTITTVDPGRAASESAASTNPALAREVARWYASYPEGAASVERVKAHRPLTSIKSSNTTAPPTSKPSRAW